MSPGGRPELAGELPGAVGGRASGGGGWPELPGGGGWRRELRRARATWATLRRGGSAAAAAAPTAARAPAPRRACRSGCAPPCAPPSCCFSRRLASRGRHSWSWGPYSRTETSSTTFAAAAAAAAVAARDSQPRAEALAAAVAAAAAEEEDCPRWQRRRAPCARSRARWARSRRLQYLGLQAAVLRATG